MIRVSATRMELLRLRRRLALARRGHKLLKDKQDELLRRFFELFDGYLALRGRLHGQLADAAGRSLEARIETPPDEIAAESWPPGSPARLVPRSVRILSLQVPRFGLEQPPWAPAHGPHQLSAAYDELASAWHRLVEPLVETAQREKALRLLAEELSALRRRVNALEYTLIPDLEAGIRAITFKLAEQELGSLTRLMRVKEVVRAH